MSPRSWQLGDVGQRAQEYQPLDRTTIFAPPARVKPFLEPAATTVKAEAPPVEEPELKKREYTCTTCLLTFAAGKRGKVPTQCPEHRPRHGRIQRRRLPVSRKARSLAQALLSCVESGALVWKTKLGDYLVMREGREYHGDTLAVAIARSSMEAAPEDDHEDAADEQEQPVLRQSA